MTTKYPTKTTKPVLAKNATSRRRKAFLTMHDRSSVTFLSPKGEENAVAELSLLRPISVLGERGLASYGCHEDWSRDSESIKMTAIDHAIRKWHNYVQETGKPGYHFAVAIVEEEEEVNWDAVLSSLTTIAESQTRDDIMTAFILLQSGGDEDLRLKIVDNQCELQLLQKSKRHSNLLFDDEMIKVGKGMDSLVSGCEVQHWVKKIMDSFDQYDIHSQDHIDTLYTDSDLRIACGIRAFEEMSSSERCSSYASSVED